MTTIDSLTVFMIIAFYLGLMFGGAWIAAKGRIPQRILASPVFYVLTLGVSIHSWTFFTSVPIAAARGYGYLGYYIGYALAFMLAPILLRPILIITRTHQLSSLADLISFRFRSPAAGILTAITLVACMLPFLALQISAVSAVTQLLVPAVPATLLAALFCLAIFVFTAIFGISGSTGRDRHQAIMGVVAIETILKLVILTALAGFCIYGVFGGFDALDVWVSRIPVEMNSLYTTFFKTSTTLVILLFFSASLVMPHMFHVTFRENSSLPNLKFASWGVPLMMVIAAFPALPVMWAYLELRPDAPLKFAAMGIALEAGSPLMTMLVLLGTLTAATGITIVSILTMTNISLNHLVYPLFPPSGDKNLYRSQSLSRRFIYFLLLGISFGIYYLVRDGSRDSDLGYLTFVACLQFLPALIAVLFWPRGNRKGVITGILVGVCTWFMLGLMPFFTGTAVITIALTPFGLVDWVMVATLSFTANLVSMVIVSLLTHTSEEEHYAGQLCSLNTLEKPRRLVLAAKNPEDFVTVLSEPLGQKVASREVHRALKELNLDKSESRPYPMQLLRDTLEANLTGLFGPTLAWQTIDRYLPYELINDSGSLDISFLESRLESFSGKLSDVAEDVDRLRRYHRQTLLDLPVGIVSTDGSGKITLWNKAMEKLTGITSITASDLSPSDLPSPWGDFLLDFINDENTSFEPKTSLQFNGSTHWLNLHKAHIAENYSEGQIIVVEDLTETQLLERELIHSERLASIGSLAAGVAHEIGNPVTAIACLAQNVRDETSDDELREMAEKIIDQTRRTSRIVQSLVEFAHAGDKQALEGENHLPEPCELRSVIDQAIDLVRLATDVTDINFINHCPAALFVSGDRQRLQQVFVNLFTNARDASEEGTSVTVTESSTDREIVISVTDEGKGIAPSAQGRVFEPFYTTKDPGKGTGLGLSMVFNILEDMGARIRLQSPTDNHTGRGTCVLVTFPR